MRRGRDDRAAPWAAGLRRARTLGPGHAEVLAAAAVFFAALSLALLGPATNLEYFTACCPLTRSLK